MMEMGGSRPCTKRYGGGFNFVLLAQPAFLPSLFSLFFCPKKRYEGQDTFSQYFDQIRPGFITKKMYHKHRNNFGNERFISEASNSEQLTVSCVHLFCHFRKKIRLISIGQTENIVKCKIITEIGDSDHVSKY